MELSAFMNSELAGRKWSFELPPKPIPESTICRTVEAELVVVGEGLSGLSTALGAVEKGVDTVIVNAGTRPVGRGGSICARYSKVMEREGCLPMEHDKFFYQEIAASSFTVDERKWYKFFNHSEEVMNRLIDIVEEDGGEVVLEDTYTDDPDSPSDIPACTHTFLNEKIKYPGMGINIALGALEKRFKALGGRVFYGMPACRLERGGTGGCVSAVIAREGEDRYVCFKAAKAVVLATGDFSANSEMMAKYAPQYAGYFTSRKIDYDVGFRPKGLYAGEGHLMALWVGAAWQKTYPNVVMIQGGDLGSHMPYGAHRGLRLNIRGERFSNEDTNAWSASLMALREPGQKVFAVWGSNYAFDIPWRLDGRKHGGPPDKPEDVIALWEKQHKQGRLHKADTLEELVGLLGLPQVTSLNEIARYNELCKAGNDFDFHKRAKYLQEIREAPFYGCVMSEYWYFTVLGGPRTDHNMRVCDENDVPLGGLYCVGTMAGDIYANAYTFRMAGQNYGFGLTLGYLTGQFIAENE